jgi:hypothetical protein
MTQAHTFGEIIYTHLATASPEDGWRVQVTGGQKSRTVHSTQLTAKMYELNPSHITNGGVQPWAKPLYIIMTMVMVISIYAQ